MTGDPQKFVTSASLWLPPLVSERSAWHGHIPFAGWIVEATRPEVFVELGTYTGVSYFAFCEAVARLRTATRCHAIDTWLGDEHVGFYGEEVFQGAAAHNAARYRSFSRLIRSTFDDALGEFEDATIDLLHIDGYHAYDAVKHDFETWLPKLSNRAVVLLHDTNEDRPGFGVRRLFTELTDRYPTFEFLHGHGLGVVGVGDDAPEAIRSLTRSDAATRQWVREVYAALGRGTRDAMRSSVLHQRARRRGRKLARQRRRLRAMRSSTSWRITAPLRWVSNRVRRLLRR